jgi:ectoine hydroxylase-related dioxygenase (phytanoyl-CoA dioxygenase family)
VSALPALDSNYPVSPEQSAAYLRDGHILLRGIATKAEVEPYRTAITDAVKKEKKDLPPMEERDTYAKAFLQMTNLWERFQEVQGFVLAKRFAKVAAELMGVDGVRIYHDQALYKEGGGGNTPWHQDQHYWPLETDKTITMWMPLIDISTEMGVLRFASGSQLGGYLGDMPISDKSEEIFQQMVKEKGFRVSPLLPMAAGDATFHSGWVLHSASGNKTQTLREVMTVIYYADGTKVGAADNKNRQGDLERWLPGCKPGGPADSKINPLVYSKR